MSRSIGKLLFKILLAPVLWLFNSCSPLGEAVNESISSNHYYSSSGTDIIYSRSGNWFNLGKSELHADVDSFMVLNPLFGRDKHGVYYEECLIENPALDPDTFYTKEGIYNTSMGFDKKHVYAFEKKYEGNKYKVLAHIVTQADPHSYVRTDNNWAKDKTNHFYRNQKFDVAYDSFEILSDYFVRDSTQIFGRANQEFQLLDCDKDSFRLYGDTPHGIDTTHLYWLSFFTPEKQEVLTIPYATIEQVNYLNLYYLKIDDTIYYDGRILAGAAAATFEVVQHGYAKDDKNVFFKGEIIPNADVASFKKEEGSFVISDKNGKYREGKIITPTPEN